MKLRDIMTHDVEVAEQEMSLREAAAKMKTLDVGALPVRQGKQLVGILTDRDITVRAVAEGYDPGKTTVGMVMSPDLVFCFEDQTVQEAARLMSDKQIRRVPVVNRNNELVGIVSLGDLAVDVSNEKLAGAALEEISAPARPTR